MDNGRIKVDKVTKVERWDSVTKNFMFVGITAFTLVVFFGSFWLFFVKLSFNWLLSLICVAVILEIYNEGFLELVKYLINKYRYVEN